MSSVPCSTCGNPALFVCSLCPSDDLASAAKYCSEACQRSHWPTHRQEHASATAATPAAASPSNQTNDYDPDCDSTAPLTAAAAAAQGTTANKKKKKRPIRVLDSDTIDDLKYYLSQIYSIVKPVVACIIFAILWVKLLNPPSQDHAYTSPPDIYALNYGGGNVNSNVTNTVINPGRETTEQQHADLLMALKTLGSVVAATVVIFVLFYFNCMKILYGIFGFIILGTLGLFTYSVSVSLLWLYLVPFDYITFFFLLWNFVAVGLVAVFWKGPLILQQSYLVVMSSLMAFMLTNPAVPPITSWILLALLAVWDLIAVLCPYGPLRLLIEASQKHNREIPAILYSAGPTTMMASPDPSRLKPRQESVVEETELEVLQPKSVPAVNTTNQVIEEQDTPYNQSPQRQQPNNNNTNNNDDDDEDGNGGMKLGLGDFVFYSVLASRAALSDWISTSSVTIALLTGLNFTIFLLVIWRKALPALPFSIAFGLLFYFSTGVCLVPFVNGLSRMPDFPEYGNEARAASSWLIVGQVGGSGMVYV